MVWFLLALLADQVEDPFRAGLIALNQNNLASAERNLEKASQLQPRDARVWLALAQTYWKLHKLEPSRAAAHNVEAYSGDPAILRALALYYSETEDYKKAEQALETAIGKNGSNEGWYFELAQLFLKQQDFAAALKALDSGRKKFDKSAQLELAAGVSYYGLRRFPEAIDAFLRTIELDRDVEQPYVFLGRMLDQAEDKLPRIAQAFAAFVQRAPDDYMSNFLYGKCLLAAGDAARAEDLLRQSIDRNGGFWESHFELGELLDQQGKYEEAAREMQRSIELNSADPVAHYRLARLYDRLGKPAEARAERELHARLSAAVK
jgi:tetratricopeptide (TPR) repeat protein